MKPFPILVAVVTLCTAVGAISWMSQPRPIEKPVAEKTERPASENPFTVSKTGPHPTAVLEEETYEFGRMVVGDEMSHDFVIRNDGDGPLTLQKGNVACKCTVPSVPEGEIAPGESAIVEMTWKPLAATDRFDKWAIVWTNDPEHEQVVLKIIGEVGDLVRVEPGSPWTVSTVNEQGETRIEGIIASGLDAFNVVSMEGSQDWLTADTRPLEEVEFKRFGPGIGSGYVIQVHVRPEMSVGRFEERLTIHTDVEKYETLEIAIVGTRPGPFSILGKEWYGGDMTVRMGNVKSSEGKSVSLSLFISRDEEPLELTSLASDPDIAQVTINRDDSFTAPAKEKYNLTFTIPPNAPVGRYVQDDRIDVMLSTNRPAMQDVNVSIEATVE